MATEGGGWTLLLRYREGGACPPGCTEVFGDGATCRCPCDGGTAAPTFVGTDFRCEEPQRSVEPSNTVNRFFDVDDPLFDGGGFEDATCVGDAESSSSFTIELADVAADPVELRLTGTEGSGSEDPGSGSNSGSGDRAYVGETPTVSDGRERSA